MIDLRFLRISQKGLYALQALIVLARHYSNGVVKCHIIAEEEGLPRKFLEVILHDLNRGQFVTSKRGAAGGYKLKRAPNTIFLGEVLRTIDQPFATSEDMGTPQGLAESAASRRSLSRVLQEVSAATEQILDRTSIADLCAK